jgi:hypothetical protein
MKKIKNLLYIAILSIGLVSNVFALGTIDMVITNFFGNIVDAVFSASTDSDDCPRKACQDCKPNDPGCRPGGH